MPKVIDIIEKMEEFAPQELALNWDNSGWQIKLDENKDVKRVLIALSPTLEVINQAIKKQCELVVTHHPLIFNGIKNIIPENPINEVIIKAIQNNIQLYAAHTNLDITKGGVNDILVNLFELQNVETFEDFAKIGELQEELSLKDFVNYVKQILSAKNVKLVNNAKKSIVKKIAVCGGAGADLIPMLANKGIDVYITGDVKYHQALEALDFAVIDAGHYETEAPVLNVLQQIANNLGTESFVAKESAPWDSF